MFELVSSPCSKHVPEPGVRHSMVPTSNHLYLIGGNPTFRSAAFPTTKQVWRTNLLSKKWDKLPTSLNNPTSIFHLQGTGMIGSNILILDAILFPERVYSMFLYPLYGSHKHKWIPVRINGHPPNSTGQRRAFVKSWDHPAELFVFWEDNGTGDGKYELAVYQLKISIHELTATWSNVEVTGRSGVCQYQRILRHKNLVFTFPGPDSLQDSRTKWKRLHVFDVKTKTWSQLDIDAQDDQWPQARLCFGLLLYKDVMYVIGGVSKIRYNQILCRANQEVLKDVWQLNMNTLKWSRHPATLPEPVAYFGATVTTEGCLYLFGGETNKGDITNRLYRLWLQPPTLKWFVMNILMTISPQMDQLTRRDLLALGIPLDYVDSLMDDHETSPTCITSTFFQPVCFCSLVLALSDAVIKHIYNILITYTRM